MILGMWINSRTKMTDDDQLVIASHLVWPFPDLLFVMRDDSKYSIPFN